MLLLDTHAWIEYFSDTPKAGEIRQLIDGKALFTSILSVAEVRLWLLRNKVGEDKYLNYVLQNSALLTVTLEIALLAGRLKNNVEKDMGMMDCLIYATALNNNLQLVSGDKHFKNKPSVIFL